MINTTQQSNISYLWNFGSLLAMCLIIQIITGVTLGMHYKPNVLEAFDSVEHIMRYVNNGLLIRYLYSNTASAFFFLVYLRIINYVYNYSLIKFLYSNLFSFFLLYIHIKNIYLTLEWVMFNFCLNGYRNNLLVFNLIRISLQIIFIFIRIIIILYNKYDIDLINIINDFENIYRNLDLKMYGIYDSENSNQKEPFFATPPTTPISTPSTVEIDIDRDKRTNNSCDCCGIKQDKVNSNCPCTDPGGFGWKRHSKSLTALFDKVGRVSAGLTEQELDGRSCCGCSKKGAFYCMSCDCIFCSRSCSENQVITALHSPNRVITAIHSPNHAGTSSVLDMEELKRAFEKLKQNPDSESSYEGKGKKRED